MITTLYCVFDGMALSGFILGLIAVLYILEGFIR